MKKNRIRNTVSSDDDAVTFSGHQTRLKIRRFEIIFYSLTGSTLSCIIIFLRLVQTSICGKLILESAIDDQTNAYLDRSFCYVSVLNGRLCSDDEFYKYMYHTNLMFIRLIRQVIILVYIYKKQFFLCLSSTSAWHIILF